MNKLRDDAVAEIDCLWGYYKLERALADDIMYVLASMVVGWEDKLGVDLAKHPEVVRVSARYREARQQYGVGHGIAARLRSIHATGMDRREAADALERLEKATGVYRDELVAERALADDLAAVLDQVWSVAGTWDSDATEVERVSARYREARKQ